MPQPLPDDDMKGRRKGREGYQKPEDEEEASSFPLSTSPSVSSTNEQQPLLHRPSDSTQGQERQQQQQRLDGTGENLPMTAYGNGEEKKRSTLLTVCPFILGNEFCERLAFYGLSTNLVIYLTSVMGYDSGFAAVQVSLFEGSCYLSPLLGAWLADSIWGRYRTILVFSVIYLVGMVSLAASAAVPGLTPEPDRFPNALQSIALYGSLYIVALGTGGIKPNVSAFGADQFDEANAADRKEKKSFFNWFYFSINLGSLLAVTCIVWIQENMSWALGFAIPAACMAIAIIVFIAGSGRYKHVAPSESPFSRVFNVIRAAYKARKTSSGRQSHELPAVDSQGNVIRNDEMGTYGYFHLPGELVSSSNQFGKADFDMSGRRFRRDPPAEVLLNNIDTVFDGSYENRGPQRTLPRTESLLWLDAAATVGSHVEGGKQFTREQVEEVKLVLRMLPVFFTTILYWTIYMQMGSFFVVQGAHLDRRVTIGPLTDFTIPAASLSMINTLAIVLLIPLYDKILVPLLRRLGRPMTLLKRIGWGLIVCVAAMFAAALTERYRLQLYKDGDVINDFSHLHDSMDNDSIIASDGAFKRGEIVDMSVWWQVPQYLLIGLSEVFTSIGQLEFFYDQAPDVMRSCSMALQLLSVCIGSYLSGAVVWATSTITSRMDPSGTGWLPKDLNEGRLDLFFLFLGGLMVLNFIIFLYVSMSYEYKTVEHKRTAAPRIILQGGMQHIPRRQPPSAPVPSMRPSAAHPSAARLESGGESPATFYGRSVTFLPQTPALPAPFR